MKVKDYIFEFRKFTRDVAEGSFWSDEEILGYLNQAEREAARRALLLADVGFLDVYAGDPIVILPKPVLLVRRARLVTGAKTLRLAGWREVEELTPDWEDSTGTPNVVLTDWVTQALRLAPTPIADDTLRAAYFRLPRNEMRSTNDEPEINARHHFALLDHMLELGYSKHDADRFDPNAAAFHAGKFAASFGPPSSSAAETIAERDSSRDRHSSPR